MNETKEKIYSPSIAKKTSDLIPESIQIGVPFIKGNEAGGLTERNDHSKNQQEKACISIWY